MNHHRVRLSFAALGAAFVLLFSTAVSAQSAQGLAARVWGLGQPQNISDLPQSQLRNDLTNLPPQASAKALKWLQEISFTGTDLEVLRVDAKGNVYFVDPFVPVSPGAKAADSASGPVTSQGSAVEDVFLLHSRPGAPNRVYLDFNGHTFSNTAWGSGSFAGVAYDIDGNPGSFSDTEKTRIADIWHRVAEDLAPFNIDVTTQRPAAFGANVGHILFSNRIDRNGFPIYSNAVGGVAFIDVWGQPNFRTYQPALVFPEGVPGAKNLAEAASHELGHNLGLLHDGQGGTSYYAGHGTGNVSWAPIMGVGYSVNVSQWSKGEYSGANNKEDDLAVIQTYGLGYRVDDHGNTASSASYFPAGTELVAAGVIERNTDVDVFGFTTGAGAITLTVGSTDLGPNLDVLAELRDANGVLIAASNPASV